MAPLVIAICLCLLGAFAMFFVVGKEPGVKPQEVALAYELAFGRGDFQSSMISPARTLRLVRNARNTSPAVR